MLHQFPAPPAARIHPMVSARSLPEFCREVGGLLADLPEAEAPEAVARLLPGLLATPGLLEAGQRVVPSGCPYGRHTVFQCPGDLFTVLAMVWPAGVVSPVHDHLTWCAFGVYEGMLKETRFIPAEGEENGRPLAVEAEVLFHRPGDAASLPVDAPDIHAMTNPTGQPTISIHVYGGNAEKQGPNLKRIYAPA
jgi:predicted metal-dependent enzyme (double-stranded beta helix superfamily)